MLIGSACVPVWSYSSALDGRDMEDDEADDGRDDMGEGAGRSMGEKRLDAEKGEYTVDGAGEEAEVGYSAEYVGDTEEEQADADDSERWRPTAATKDGAV